MAIHQIAPEKYEQQLQEKLTRIEAQFEEFSTPKIDVFKSPSIHYRQRAEFKIWQEGQQAHYAMFEHGEPKKPIFIEQFNVGSLLINALMPRLLSAINNNETLRKKLFQLEILTTKKGEALISLIYHKALDETWQTEAKALKTALNVDIIGRSRKQKILLDRDFVLEELNVNGLKLHYQQVEGSFTQPNAAVCESMLEWAQKNTENSTGDLLELYCGNGNFTIPLSRNFERVLATEISKTSVESAKFNFSLNQVHNVEIARMSSEELTQAMDGARPFRRLKNITLSDYNFTTLFVDPPRSGLDRGTLALSQRFDTIMYISCNADTLAENIRYLAGTHKVSKFAIFDQFPYTHHVECGAILQRR